MPLVEFELTIPAFEMGEADSCPKLRGHCDRHFLRLITLYKVHCKNSELVFLCVFNNSIYGEIFQMICTALNMICLNFFVMYRILRTVSHF
jgi:hypothetical protein